jgi:nucleotide-binding universal stress UspA family protein
MTSEFTSSSAPLLVYYDGSADAARAVEAAGALFPVRPTIVLFVASRPATQRVRTTSVAVLRDELLEEARVAARRDAAAVAEQGASLARRAGLEVRPLVSESDGDTSDAVMRVASDAAAIAIVVGRRRPRGRRSLRSDSLPRRLIDQCRLPVVCV